jgi:alpha-glucosidase
MVWQASAANAGFAEGEPWLPIDPRHLPLAADRQHGVEGSVLEATRKLLRFRREHPALKFGDVKFIDAGPDLLAFERFEGAERVLCVCNLGQGAHEFAAPAERDWQVSGSLNAALGDGHWKIGAHGFLIATR